MWSLYIPNETRPLSHEITAVCLFLIYTERNAAVKSWDDGRLFVPSIYTERNEAVKSWDNGRFSFGHYIYRTS